MISLALLMGCNGNAGSSVPAGSTFTAPTPATAEQEREIRALIDQLVFEEGDAKNQPVYSPGVDDDSDEYRKRFEKCHEAFSKLTAYRSTAFPYLVEHLDDKRASIQFRNHYLNNSVGNACYWIIYFQLQDKPPGYSQYGYSREGRDGKQHPKPYWQGTPFDEAGGVKEWLEANKNLSYPQMQVKCVQWLLDREKAIGAPNAESYFRDILPLEIRILERRAEAGEQVEAELARLRKVMANRSESDVPKELLP